MIASGSPDTDELEPVFQIARARGARDLEWIARIDRACFPADLPVEIDGAEWWLARHGDTPVAFAGARIIAGEPGALLCRAGVRRDARGWGLQRRLIRARVAWARRLKLEAAVTYTVIGNHASANSLIGCGFKLYDPACPWVGRKGVAYWIRQLKR